LSWIPGGSLWAWFKPAHAPGDVIVRIPDELRPLLDGHLTMRQVLAALELSPVEIQFWSLQGVVLDPQGGQNPLLDQLLPAPAPWVDSSITIRPLPPGMPPTGGMPGMANAQPPSNLKAVPMTAAAESLLSAMDADWNAILLMETQLTQLRKQLNTAQGRLQAMNRDFTPEERQAADSNDVKNWQDARRFLRDAAGHTSRYIREHDVGVTSAAGQRSRFEDLYKTYLVPRRAFEGMASVQHELEAYRKQVQAFLAKMQTALSNAGTNGEQRAQQVLNRVAAKMRRSRN